MHRAFSWGLLGFWAAAAGAAETLPPVPARHFNDYAQVVTAAVASELNTALQTFERQTSTQVVVAVFPRLASDSSVNDYAQRLAESWKLGRKGKNNGVVLFVFMQERTMDIEVGYGLEGALPDVLAKRIIEEEIKPKFRNGDYAGGLGAGVNAIMQAVRGEYRGNGTTAGGEAGRGQSPGWGGLVWLVFFPAIFFLLRLRRMRGTVFRGNGRQTYWGGFGGGSGSGGGFSGGGGSFGGGGASGRW